MFVDQFLVWENEDIGEMDATCGSDGISNIFNLNN